MTNLKLKFIIEKFFFWYPKSTQCIMHIIYRRIVAAEWLKFLKPVIFFVYFLGMIRSSFKT